MAKFEQPIMAYLANAVAESGSAEVVTLQTGLLENGLLDSIGLVGLIQFIESEFGVEIPEADVSPELFETPASIADYIARRQG